MEEVRWCEVPSEVLTSIAVVLELPDMIRASMVCKSWQLVISPICRRELMITPMYPLDPSLPLIIQQTSARSPWLQDNRRILDPWNGKTYEIHVPGLRNMFIVHSYHGGWVLAIEESIYMTIQNPILLNIFTGSRVDLPSIEMFSCDLNFCFSNAPTSSSSSVGEDLTVFLINHYPWNADDAFLIDAEAANLDWDSAALYVGWWRLGDKEWEYMLLGATEASFKAICCSPVFVDGLLYVLGQGGLLGIFDPVVRTWKVVIHVPCTNRHVSGDGNFAHMVAFHDDIFVAFTGPSPKSFHDVAFQVFKLDKSRMAFGEVDNLEGKTVFLKYGGKADYIVELDPSYNMGNNIFNQFLCQGMTIPVPVEQARVVFSGNRLFFVRRQQGEVEEQLDDNDETQFLLRMHRVFTEKTTSSYCEHKIQLEYYSLDGRGMHRSCPLCTTWEVNDGLWIMPLL